MEKFIFFYKIFPASPDFLFFQSTKKQKSKALLPKIKYSKNKGLPRKGKANTLIGIVIVAVDIQAGRRET